MIEEKFNITKWQPEISKMKRTKNTLSSKLIKMTDQDLWYENLFRLETNLGSRRRLGDKHVELMQQGKKEELSDLLKSEVPREREFNKKLDSKLNEVIELANEYDENLTLFYAIDDKTSIDDLSHL